MPARRFGRTGKNMEGRNSPTLVLVLALVSTNVAFIDWASFCASVGLTCLAWVFALLSDQRGDEGARWKSRNERDRVC